MSTIQHTARIDEVLTFNAAHDAVWTTPDARTFLGPWFAWAFPAAGTFTIGCSDGTTHTVNVAGDPGGPVIKLPGGHQTLRKTITEPGTRIVAADPSNPPIVNGGFNVAAKGVVIRGIVFDGDTDVTRAAIDVKAGGSVNADHIELRNVGGGIRCETSAGLGTFARNIKAGSGVKKYPFGVFGAHDFALIDFHFEGYSGIEHCLRIEGQSTANGFTLPKNGLIAYGNCWRNGDGKEALTVRKADGVSIHDVNTRGGYAGIRLFLEQGNGNPTLSHRVYVRRCTLNRPIEARWVGCDGLTISDNKFIGVNGPAIKYTAGHLRNVLESHNHRDNAGAMHSGEAGIAGYTYVP